MRDVRLVFLTMNEDPAVAAEAFRAGASAYLLKRSAASELSTALDEVMRGRSYVTPLMTGAMVEVLLDRGESRAPPALTPRQREVLQLLAEGRSMKEVATVLSVAPRTVAFHKYQMMKQLGITSTAELIQYAVRQHLV
jgi:DNA-binding NarL/FixJ family response regulator